VASGQHDAAMIDHLLWGRRGNLFAGEGGSLDQRSATGWAPIGNRLFGEQGAAMAADSLHILKLTGWGCSAR